MAKVEDSAIRVINDALVLLRQDKGISLPEFTGGVDSVLGRKCRSVYDSCREEVLLARKWGFVIRKCELSSSLDSNHKTWVASLPRFMITIKKVRGINGREIRDWERRGPDCLASSEKIFSIEYIEDVRNIDQWPTFVRRALVFALARDLAIPITGRQKDLETMNALYTDKLKQAAMHDACDEKPDRSIWGRNVYADRIRGAFEHRERSNVI